MLEFPFVNSCPQPPGRESHKASGIYIGREGRHWLGIKIIATERQEDGEKGETCEGRG